jgi:hypothetical protein
MEEQEVEACSAWYKALHLLRLSVGSCKEKETWSCDKNVLLQVDSNIH